MNPIVPHTDATDEALVTDSSHVSLPIATAAPPVRARSRAAAFTVADGLMLLIGGLAAWLRLGDLAGLPLSPAEATAALANRQFWSAVPLDVPVTSPAYFAFTHLVMSLGGSSDTVARLVPAIFGVLTVLLVWAWRGRARPVAQLTAGLFLAISPLLVAVSRTAGGNAIALFALLALAVAARGLLDGRRPWIIAAGMALGLGLTSSPLFYTGLVALIIAILVTQPFRRRPPVAQAVQLANDKEGKLDSLHYSSQQFVGGGEEGELDSLRYSSQQFVGGGEEGKLDSLRYIGLAAGATFVTVATSLLLHPAGLGAALRLFPTWLAQFGLPSSAAAAFSPLLALLRYEPAAVVLGLPAVVAAVLGRGRFRRALALWFGVALLLTLLQPGVMVNVTAALLPAYLLVGLSAASIADRRDPAPVAGRRTGWFTAAAILGLGALMLAAGGRFTRLNLLAGENATLISLAILAFILAGAAVVLAMAWESPAARRGAFLGAAVLLLFWQWGAAWQLSRAGANDPRERWVAEGSTDDVPVMIDLLGDISRQVRNSNRDLIIFSQVDSPVLRWYLGDFVGFQSGPALPMNTSADVVITAADSDPSLPADYFGADFGLVQRDPLGAGPSTVSDVLKWWLFRESTAVPETQRVVVWVRSDLANAE